MTPHRYGQKATDEGGEQMKTRRVRGVCKFDGCGRRHDARGYCPGHYRQLVAGKTLQPIQARHRPKNEVVCEHCGHTFFPRIEDHQNRCAACRGRFKTGLAVTRRMSAMAPEGKRWCRDCERYRAAKFFPGSSARCKPCLRAYDTERRAQKVYSLEPGMYEALHQFQGGRCYICRRATGRTKALSVDHDHSCCPGKESCGKCVRGLLCSGCNYKVLGHLRDDTSALSRAIDYLTDPPARKVLNR